MARTRSYSTSNTDARADNGQLHEKGEQECHREVEDRFGAVFG